MVPDFMFLAIYFNMGTLVGAPTGKVRDVNHVDILDFADWSVRKDRDPYNVLRCDAGPSLIQGQEYPELKVVGHP